HLDIGVDITDALFEAGAELADRWDFDAVDARDDTRLRELCSHGTDKEAGLIFAELHADQIRHGAAVELIDTDKVYIRVQRRRRRGNLGNEEADGYNRIVSFVDAAADVGFVVGLRGRLDNQIVEIVLLRSGQHAFIGGLVERAVIDTTDIGDEAN